MVGVSFDFPKWVCSGETQRFKIQTAEFVEAEETDSTTLYQMHARAMGEVWALRTTLSVG